MVPYDRVTVIVDANQVYINKEVMMDMDFSNCGIPSDIHALQFWHGKGEVEYRDSRPNLNVTELPDWAQNCVNLFLATKEADPSKVHNYE